VIFGVGAGSAASAHANYMRSDPAPNAHLATPPARILVGFSEPFVVATSDLTLLDAGGRQLAAGARTTTDPTELALTLPSLADGVYTVAWQTVSATDGDPTHGYFAFMVGTGTTPSGAGTSKSASQSNIDVGLAIAPLVAGENRYTVTVAGTTTVSRVRLRITPLDRDLGQSEIVLPLAGAAYSATGLELPIAGRYQVQVQVRRSDTLADLAYDFEFSVPSAASPTPTPSSIIAVTTPTAAPLAGDSWSVTLALAAMLVVFAGLVTAVLVRRRR